MNNTIISNFVSPFDVPFEPLSNSRDVIRVVLDGTSSNIPVIRIDGREPGPSLLVTAGIHGAEYPGIETLVRLGSALDAATVAGRLVLIPVANSAAFRERTAFTTPPDGKNLNRSFPGNPSGSYTEQLAFVLHEYFLSRADAYVDLHSGDLVEALHPFCSFAVTGDDGLDAASRRMAHAFGFESVIRFTASGSRLNHSSMTHVSAAISGVPSILAEIGGQGVWNESDVDRFTDGVLATLRHLGMLSPAPGAISGQTVTEYRRFDWYSATSEGLWYPATNVGAHVEDGQILGTIRSVFGETLSDVVATDDGLAIFQLSALSVREGDPLIGIAADRTN